MKRINSLQVENEPEQSDQIPHPTSAKTANAEKQEVTVKIFHLCSQ